MAAEEVDIFIDTVITNNEERSLERLLKRYVPNIQLKQLRYLKGDPEKILQSFSHFNPNKEVAYVRRAKEKPDILDGICFLRWDDGAEEGVFYVCRNVTENELDREEIRNIFANPHASTITCV